jgi:CheY-like chemotaxis protein
MEELDFSMLIVDPNDAIRKLLIAQCRGLGLFAHGVSGAKQATCLLRFVSYVVLLVEQDLPEMNGRELIRRAHEICPFPPRLCILMGDRDRSDQAADDHEITAFLQKPIHTQKLAQAIFARLLVERSITCCRRGIRLRPGHGRLRVTLVYKGLTNLDENSLRTC